MTQDCAFRCRPLVISHDVDLQQDRDSLSIAVLGRAKDFNSFIFVAKHTSRLTDQQTSTPISSDRPQLRATYFRTSPWCLPPPSKPQYSLRDRPRSKCHSVVHSETRGRIVSTKELRGHFRLPRSTRPGSRFVEPRHRHLNLQDQSFIHFHLQM